MKQMYFLAVLILFTIPAFSGELLKQGDTLPLCIGDDCSKEYPHLTNKKVQEYQALERALAGGGTQAIIRDASKIGCFDRVKIVGGKEVKQCWGAIRPAGKDSKWECEELSRREKPECYETEK